jgi:hypothetical protein
MPLWGNSDSNESKPKWLQAGSKVIDPARVFATNRGWVYRWDKGNGRYFDELLVAIRGLGGTGSSDKLTNPTVTEVKWITTSVTVGTGKSLTVQVGYNEAVTVSGTPTVSVGGNTLSYYSAGSTPSIGLLQFRNTNSTVASGTTSLSFGGTGSISLNSGTIKEEGNSNNAELSLAEATAVVLNVG